MRITAIDIQQQQFKSRPMGYDKAGVDHFLEQVAVEVERLNRQNQDLQEELARAKGGLAEVREREATLNETLLTTQRITEELKANAKREAELVVADAELRAERMMQKAEERRMHLLDEIQEIKRQKIAFETNLRAQIERHLRMLEPGVLSVRDEPGEERAGDNSLPFAAAPSARPAPAPAAPAAPRPVRTPAPAAPPTFEYADDDF